MSTFIITWKSNEFNSVANHTRTGRGSIDDFKREIDDLNKGSNTYGAWLEIDRAEPYDEMDDFRLTYAQYCAYEFEEPLDLYMPLKSSDYGWDVPTWGAAYTTTEDGEHDLQVLYVPSELCRVYYVDMEEVHTDRFETLADMTQAVAWGDWSDYVGDCEQYGIAAGLISEEMEED